ncbi:MAG: mandelate racemase/muconate lactonizing enzyme family protein [Saprospiraceae bacterium]|nr:mandelate racemase/muconate lactonizing enzyme family protein [Saprospiraceae bacterium]
MKRRTFLATAATASGFALSCTNNRSAPAVDPDLRYARIDQAAHEPVLQLRGLGSPILISSLELLRHQDNFICRVRSTAGAEGISVGNNMQLKGLYPIFSERLQPFFIGRDARQWEQLLDEVYVYRSNYKLQNLALWVPLATIEFAVLDMLGKLSGQSIGEMLGGVEHPSIAVYRANNFRGKSAEESVARIEENAERSQAKAVKFKIGGRMSKNADDPPGRTEALIPLVRKTLGPDMTIYADSNGSYDVPEALRVGRILQDYAIDFYEEPTPFDWYEETRVVAESLDIAIAGGEQEPSMRNFRWLIGNNALDIVQPDIFYFGGMVRSMRVARMAAAVGKSCVPHISGSGLGYLYMMHFVSALSNAGPYHEFKGFNASIPLSCDTSSLSAIGGEIKVPTGPGMGIDIDPEFIQKHLPV